LARIGAPSNFQSICVPSNRQGAAFRNGRSLVVRASSESSVAEVSTQDKFAVKVDKDSIVVDPSGNRQIEVKGDYLEDGWVDEKAAAGSGLGGFFGGLFGGTKTSSSKQETLRAEQTMAELDVIEYLDGTKGSLQQAVRGGSAVPFGGLNPRQIEAYNQAKELKKVKMAALTQNTEAFYIQYPKARQVSSSKAAELPDGWYSALDEASGSEYYYNDEGETTWEPPRRR
jgi:hypothetical protein